VLTPVDEKTVRIKRIICTSHIKLILVKNFFAVDLKLSLPGKDSFSNISEWQNPQAAIEYPCFRVSKYPTRAAAPASRATLVKAKQSILMTSIAIGL
jgi:hypothetical protein